MRALGLFSTIAVMMWPVAVRAADWHVAPEGTADGDGSEAAPWDVATAFAHPATVMPGDTIWLHGESYPIVGALTGVLAGTAEQPIVMRAIAGDRVTLDTGDSGENRIFIEGAYAWYWGFEVMSSAEDRWADDGNAADRGYSIDAGGGGNPGIKLINLVVHDTQGAIGFWSGLTESSEVYGCLIYFNGYDAEDRGHGHAIYTQNVEGPKILRDNVMFGQYSHGIHAYTEGGQINDFVMEGNISFENGVISTISGRTRNLLIGGAPVAEDPQLRENFGWFDRSAGEGTSCDIGYGSGTSNAIAEGNVCVGGNAFRVDGAPVSIAGNTFVGAVEGLDVDAFPDNELFPDASPSGALSFVRVNAYDPERAHVVVYNWDLAETVEVDLSPLLGAGDGYELRDVQNYYGDPVLVGEYEGPVGISMTTAGVASVIGTPATAYVHTSAEFGAFVLVRTSVGMRGSDESTGGGDTGGSDDGASEGSVSATGGGWVSATMSDGGGSAGTGDEGSGSESSAGVDEQSGGCGCNGDSPRSLGWLVSLVLIPWSHLRRRSSARV